MFVTSGDAFDVATPVRRPTGLLARRVAPARLLAGLFAWLCVDQLLLWRFLGVASPLPFAAGLGATVLVVAAAARSIRGEGPTVRLLLVLLVVATAVYALGGEGRLFYANTDWRVRDGVLRDMAIHPWPFSYLARGVPEVLRAPLGLYLVPALAMKLGGQAAGDAALLAQDALLLTVLLGLAAALFPSTRSRAAALATFLAFSGLDVLGVLLARGVPQAGDHLEWWLTGFQFSSTLTLAFWVPQHAMAGWVVAVLYLSWRTGRLAPGVLAASLPLVALWSPLAAIGGSPFVAFAGVEALRRGVWTRRDAAITIGAAALCAPSLSYLSAAGDSVGAHLRTPRLSHWVLFEVLETAPFLFLAATDRSGRRFGAATTVLTAAVLLTLPGVQVGFSADLMMRASIPALAVLAVLTADQIVHGSPGRRAVTAALLALGSVTGFSEVWRALTWPASPPPLCSFFGAWGPSAPELKSTYLAPVSRLPAAIRPASTTPVRPGDPARCWARDWPTPRGLGA